VFFGRCAIGAVEILSSSLRINDKNKKNAKCKIVTYLGTKVFCDVASTL
jgi:hypothetical protein